MVLNGGKTITSGALPSKNKYDKGKTLIFYLDFSKFKQDKRYSLHVSIGGSVLECSPATRAARVRFPADAYFFNTRKINFIFRFTTGANLKDHIGHLIGTHKTA